MCSVVIVWVLRNIEFYDVDIEGVFIFFCREIIKII